MKFLLPDLAEVTNKIFYTSQHEVLINMVLSYNESHWSERISDNFLDLGYNATIIKSSALLLFNSSVAIHFFHLWSSSYCTS